MSPLWDGLWGAIIAAAVSAIVAVVVVRLTRRHDRARWVEQQRVAAFAELLTAWHACWDVTSRSFEYYSTRSTTDHDPNFIDTDRCMRLQDADREEAVSQLRTRVAVWRLYTERESQVVVEAMTRAFDFITMEWLYQSHQPRGHLPIPVPGHVLRDWEMFADDVTSWHIQEGSARPATAAKVERSWLTPPKTWELILHDFPDSLRQGLD